MITAAALAIALVGQGTTSPPQAAGRELTRISAVVAHSESRADEIATQFRKAPPEDRTPDKLNCRLLGGEGPLLVLVDNEIFRQSVIGHHDRVMDLLRTIGPEAALEWNKLDPASQEDLRTLMLKMSFRSSGVLAYLQSPNPKVGTKAYSKVTATLGDTKIEMFLEPGGLDRSAKLVQEDWSFEDQNIAANRQDIKDLAAKMSEWLHPPKLVFRFLNAIHGMQYSTSALPKISKLLDDALQAELDKATDKRKAVADSWMKKQMGGAEWPPAEGSKFDSLSPGVQEALEKLLHERMPNYKFASKAEASEFLRNAKLQFGPSEISLCIAFRDMKGVVYVSSVTLSSIRF